MLAVGSTRRRACSPLRFRLSPLTRHEEAPLHTEAEEMADDEPLDDARAVAMAAAAGRRQDRGDRGTSRGGPQDPAATARQPAAVDAVRHPPEASAAAGRAGRPPSTASRSRRRGGGGGERAARGCSGVHPLAAHNEFRPLGPAPQGPLVSCSGHVQNRRATDAPLNVRLAINTLMDGASVQRSTVGGSRRRTDGSGRQHRSAGPATYASSFAGLVPLPKLLTCGRGRPHASEMASGLTGRDCR